MLKNHKIIYNFMKGKIDLYKKIYTFKNVLVTIDI